MIELEMSKKIEILNRKLTFWTERLNEGTDAIGVLSGLGNQTKIDMNAQSIKDAQSVINSLQLELDRLTA